MKAIDVHGFGGGFALGAVQAGWELEAKMSLGLGFGVRNTLANRHMLGDRWDSIAVDPAEWDTFEADLVFGNPPCSGFSKFTKDYGKVVESSSGIHAAVNKYMWHLIDYAGRVKPPMVIFESVQATFRDGLELMRALHDALEEKTGLKYDLHHVLHNAASVGGVAIRRRYFWVASRVPFGIESCVVRRDGSVGRLERLPTLGDMLRDLEPLEETMRAQPYRGVDPGDGRYDDPLGFELTKPRAPVRVLNSSWWNEQEIHDGTGIVDGHDVEHSPAIDRINDLIFAEDNQQGVPWFQGEGLSMLLRRYYELHGKLPWRWQFMTHSTKDGRVLTKEQQIVESNFAGGRYGSWRWRADNMSRAITGGSKLAAYHPTRNRPLTNRELARIQGFPDDWKIWPVRNASDLASGWGKGVPIQAARWIAYWAKQSLEGNPGTLPSQAMGEHSPISATKHGPREREYVYDITEDFRTVAAMQGLKIS